jgi:Sec7 domain
LFIFAGIEYLYENHLLRTDPKDVAQFLYKGEGLNKTAIGKCRKNLNPHCKCNLGEFRVERAQFLSHTKF